MQLESWITLEPAIATAETQPDPPKNCYFENVAFHFSRIAALSR
jgi:hypothetical protein